MEVEKPKCKYQGLRYQKELEPQGQQKTLTLLLLWCLGNNLVQCRKSLGRDIDQVILTDKPTFNDELVDWFIFIEVLEKA